LLSEIERLILAAFKQEGPLPAARKEIEHAARYVGNLAVDVKLRAFLTRVIDPTTEDSTWLESIATLLTGKPPPHWDDQVRARFEVQLSATARTFEHFRVLAFEMERGGAAILDGDPRMLRVSVTVPDAGRWSEWCRFPLSCKSEPTGPRRRCCRRWMPRGCSTRRRSASRSSPNSCGSCWPKLTLRPTESAYGP